MINGSGILSAPISGKLRYRQLRGKAISPTVPSLRTGCSLEQAPGTFRESSSRQAQPLKLFPIQRQAPDLLTTG